MKDANITTRARRLANRLPDQPAEADRRRRRFPVERVWSEGTRYQALTVRVDQPDFLASHIRPGQYVTFEYGSVAPRFLVIASAPDAADGDRWEFLIDRDSDLGDAVGPIRPGHRVRLSRAEGSGYPAAPADMNSVLIFTTGAGIASVRPVMQYWRQHPDAAPSNLAVYYGEADRDQFAYVQELADWRARGARVFQAVENLADPEEGYRYVQHAFDADAPRLDDTLVYVSGASVMMELVIAKLLRLGVPERHIHINV